MHPDTGLIIQTGVNNAPDQISPPLANLGWSSFFAEQVTPDGRGLVLMRVATVHRARMTAETGDGPVRLILPLGMNTTDFAVGDWVLTQPDSPVLVRRLDRRTLLERHTEGARVPQLIAANIDTVFIATSCNDDLNPARLERYLALVNEAGIRPVIVLTKADQVPDVAPFRDQVMGLQRDLPVVAVNAKSPDAALALFRRAPVSVELPTGPARRIAIRGEGVGFFVHSAVADDIAAGRLAEIRPSDVDTVHRDIAMVVRDSAVLDREMLRDFATEIAEECVKNGTILEATILPRAANAA